MGRVRAHVGDGDPIGYEPVTLTIGAEKGRGRDFEIRRPRRGVAKKSDQGKIVNWAVGVRFLKCVAGYDYLVAAVDSRGIGVAVESEACTHIAEVSKSIV